MATITWNGSAGDHDWDNGSNWVGGIVPGASDNAVVPSGGFTVNLNDGLTDSIASLTVASGDTIAIGADSLTIANASTISGTLDLNGGALILKGATKIQTFDQEGGVLSSTATITVSGSASFGFNGGSLYETGSGTINLLGTTTVGSSGGFSNLYLNNGWTFENSGNLT
jgi:hypothetical protein